MYLLKKGFTAGTEETIIPVHNSTVPVRITLFAFHERLGPHSSSLPV